MLTPTITAVAGAAVATTVALVNGAIASRAKESEELRSLRLQTYLSVWSLTSQVPRWPRGDPAYRDLWTLHRSLRTWYFSTGGLYLSENARARYGEMQELLDAVLCGRPEDDTTPVRELAPLAETDKPETVYEALMNTCSAFRTALTEDLATRRTRSIVWVTALWLRHGRQRRAARRRIAAARGRLSKRDPGRVGGLVWVQRTGGCLTSLESMQLSTALILSLPEHAAGLMRLMVGWIASKAACIDVRRFKPPDSDLARQAEKACAELPPEIVMHSYRTWILGLALAELDGCQLDPDFFYCAALLHDYGLVPPNSGRDFTLASADRAIACATAAGLARDRADMIADAICVHPTPGVSPARDGPLGCYVQWGSMADVVGLRLWKISKANRQEVLREHPRGQSFKAAFITMFRSEAKAVPRGRFALLVRWGITLAIRIAPLGQ